MCPTRPTGQIVRLRSTWEAAVAAYLDRRGVRWEYESHRHTLDDRTYCPDFWLPDTGVYWEVKGWLHARHAETIRQFRARDIAPLVVIGRGSIRGFMEQRT